MGSRFKGRVLGAIKVDERGGAKAGAAGGVGCFDVGKFCEIARCRSAGPNGVISSNTTSGGEACACLRAFCCGTCGTFFLWLLSIVLSATKFESPVCKGGLMGSRFKDTELRAIEADERGGTETGAAGGVGCLDVGNFCRRRRVSIGRPQQRHLIRSDERWRGKRVSAGLLLRHLVAAVDCLVGN